MAGSAVIGSLRVNLGIDSAEFAKGAARAQSSLGALAGSFKAFAAGALAALSFGAVTRALTSAIDKADELGKAAQKIGIPVEELSKLEYAARISDVSLEQLSTGVGRLSKNMAAIASGEGGDAGRALSAIGVAATTASGQLRPTSEVIADIAGKFAGMRDGAGKTALAMAIFGKSGADLIPLLNTGREGIAGMAAEAERFGITISGQTAKAAEGFNDNLTRLSAAGQGLVLQIAEQLLPQLVNLTDGFVELAKGGETAAGIADTIGFVLREITKSAIAAKQVFFELSTVWNTMAANWSEGGGMAVAMERWKKGFADIEKSADAARQAIKEVDAPRQKPTEFLKSDRETLKIEAPILPPIPPAKELPATKKAYEDLGAAGQRVWEQTRTPLESHQMELRKLNGLLAEGAIDHDTYARAVKQLQDGFGGLGAAAESLGQQLGETLGSTLQGWLNGAIDGTFKLKDALKGLLADLTKVAVNNLFGKLTGGSAGGGLFAGLGKLMGFAQGGSFNVGGAGGIDSQVVAFRATPGERVDVSKSGQGQGGGVTVIANFNGSNNDATGMAMLRADVQNLRKSMPQIIKSGVTHERTRNPGFAR